jgi:hypothetical protein
MIEKPAKYLDKILNSLAINFGTSLTIQQLQNIMTPVSFFGTTGNVVFSQDLMIDLHHALDYLSNQNLIHINNITGEVSLTFEGYIKIKTKGFSKEIREKSLNQTLQRIAWIIPIFISTFALIISLSKTKESLPIKYKSTAKEKCCK